MMKRDIVRKNEGRLSMLQIIGFSLIAIGVIYLLINLFFYSVNAADASINFFLIMLGFALAFPDLLEDQNKGLSTMRIIVFMMTNVICMLLLKIGWGEKITSLGDIGLDQWWMGLIAFVFGAKAMQTYFESKMAVANKVTGRAVQQLQSQSPVSDNASIAKLAIEQNQDFLLDSFPNILSISDAVHDLDSDNTHVVAIYLKDNNIKGIPNRLIVEKTDGTTGSINTEIIKNVGSGSIQINQAGKIQSLGSSNTGSVCCVVKTKQNAMAVVTAGHVYSNGKAISEGGELFDDDKTPICFNGKECGRWYFQLINTRQDVALATLSSFTPDSALISFKSKEHFIVADKDVKTKTPNAVLVSTESGRRQGFILDYNTAWSIPYEDGEKFKANIVLIGSTNNRDDSVTVSKPGDSGGCVYHSETKRLIGLILGGNNKFTWVLPLNEVFEKNNIQLL